MYDLFAADFGAPPRCNRASPREAGRRIRESVKEKKMGNIDISAGIVEYDYESSAEGFIKTADDALYEAKKQGRK